jgi:hypothetical protein
MARSFLRVVLLLILAFGGPAGASVQEDFATAVRASGGEYEQARDRLLRSGVSAAFLRSRLQSSRPEERITAFILSGWRENGNAYRRLLSGRAGMDREGTRRYSWSYDPGSVQPHLLPLMYEWLLKDVGGAGEKDAAVRVTGFLARQGVPLDLQALSAGMRQDRSPVETRAAVARTLASLPLVKAEDLLALLQTEAEGASRSKTVVGHLMDGLIRLGKSLPDQNKDSVVDRLLGMASLRQLVGETLVVYTAGGIGGDRAAARVAEFVEQAQDLSQRRWALSTLGTMGNEKAAQALLKYAASGEGSPELRLLAIESLGKTRFIQEVGAALEQISRSEERPERERVEAVKSLGHLHRRHLRDLAAEPDIRALLERLDPEAVAGPDLKAQIHKVQEGLRQRLPQE